MMKLLSVIGLLASCASPSELPPDASPADGAPFTRGVSTLAGRAESGSTDGPRNVALFSNPVNVVPGSDGTLYVADFDNNVVRMVDRDGNVSTLIQQQGFQRPFGLAISASGTLYVQTDDDPTGLHSPTTGTVWRVDVSARTAVAVAANLGRPRGLAVLPDGRIAMADHVHHVLRLLDPETGATTNLAGATGVPGYVDGTGDAARFSQPYALAVRGDALVVTDFDNHRLRLVQIATGETTTFAGTGQAAFSDGELATAAFSKPQGLVTDTAGVLYITDTGNFRVRRIRGTTVETVAGSGTGGYLDADDRLSAELFGLEGLGVSRDDATLFVADGNRGENLPHNRIRLVHLTP